MIVNNFSEFPAELQAEYEHIDALIKKMPLETFLQGALSQITHFLRPGLADDPIFRWEMAGVIGQRLIEAAKTEAAAAAPGLRAVFVEKADNDISKVTEALTSGYAALQIEFKPVELASAVIGALRLRYDPLVLATRGETFKGIVMEHEPRALSGFRAPILPTLKW